MLNIFNGLVQWDKTIHHIFRKISKYEMTEKKTVQTMTGCFG
jgi:hypothetical protein